MLSVSIFRHRREYEMTASKADCAQEFADPFTRMALLLRLLPPEQKRSSSTVCPFDFSFDNLDDAIEPRHRLHRNDRNLPRFHEWARRFPLRIVKGEPALPLGRPRIAS